MTVTLSEITKRAAEKTGLKTSEAHDVAKAIFDEIVLANRSGNDVRIQDFGIFKRKAVAARTIKDFRSGKIMNVPARNRMAFKAARSVAAAMG